MVKSEKLKVRQVNYFHSDCYYCIPVILSDLPFCRREPRICQYHFEWYCCEKSYFLLLLDLSQGRATRDDNFPLF